MIFFPCRVRNISLGVIQLINAILESNPNKILKQTKNRQLLSLKEKQKKSHVKADILLPLLMTNYFKLIN